MNSFFKKDTRRMPLNCQGKNKHNDEYFEVVE